MSEQQPDQAPQQQQPTVRHIPIFVEGRSEPLVNTHPESQPSTQSSHHHQQQQQPHHHHHHPSAGLDSPGGMPEMPSRNDFFNHGSIFEKARHIPVRNQFPGTGFMSGFKREPSPGGGPPTRTSPFADIGNHMRPDGSDPLHVPRGSSVPRQTPSPPTANHHQPQAQQQVPRTAGPPPPPPTQSQDQPDSRPRVPVKDDPITKIQKIQKDVLAIFDQVEQFKGGKEGKRDKAYVYLDEMLTQNLLKLDSIDAEDQPQIKSARKEAIKSINTCIAVLEAKAEAGAANAASSGSIGGSSNGLDAPNGTNQSASNTSIPRSSSNSSQQQTNETEAKQ